MDSSSAAARASALRNGSKSGSFGKFLGRINFVLVLLALIVALGVLGVNASILAIYNASKADGKWMDEAGSEKVWWDAWPAEGVDMKPISAYVGLSAWTVVVMAVLFAWSLRNRMGQTAGVMAVVACIVTFLLEAKWVAVTVLYQYEAGTGSGKHSYR